MSAKKKSRPRRKTHHQDRNRKRDIPNVVRLAKPDQRSPHRFNVYRTQRLAQLLGVYPSTIWRWRKTGKLPAPVKIGGILGWTEEQVAALLAVAS
jgi:predicted DNA-binding transcriptional regulator AlpA